MDPLLIFQHPGFSLRLDQDDAPERRATVLVIDDNKKVRAYLRDGLRDTYTIEEASDSENGVRLAKQIIPDLIITALTTQDQDNESICLQLKHFDKTNHIPIVVLSEGNDPSSRIKSFHFGADDYMALPLQHAELQIRIENLIQSRRTLQRKFSKQIELKLPPIEVQSKDQIFLQRVMRVMQSNMHNPLFGSEEFAEQMGVCHRHLSRKLMFLTGQSSNEFIRQMRLQRAAELLNKQTGKVKEVAHQVGFNNLSYFAKCFKEHHKCSPSDYSKRMDYPQQTVTFDTLTGATKRGSQYCIFFPYV
jgi:response regulator RpfG family c-di-GMP phosphodiesterase